MKTINFSKNWNNKLNCEYFTTIRPKANEFDYDKYKIICPTVEPFVAEVVLIEEYTLEEIIKGAFGCRTTLVDSGFNYEEFEKFMYDIYGKKEFWRGDETPLVILTLKKLSGVEV